MPARKKILVAGASSGIGKAIAIRFAAEGWDVCLNARREKELRALCSGLPAGNHLVCPGDYSDPATAESVYQAIHESWGHLDALVNSAGVSWPVDAIASPVEQWRKPFDIMLMGAVYMTRVAVRLMVGDPPGNAAGGRIVHVTSIHGERVERMQSSYAMVKAALNQYCRALALELAPQGIRVNAIAPGFIDTPMSVVDGVSELETPWFKDNYVVGNHLPLRRAGQPEEIAGVALFLAGPDATYITGQVLTVDGGLTITF